jgi:hypothetical protein
MFTNEELNYVVAMYISMATGQFTLSKMNMQNMSMGVTIELGLEYYISTAAIDQNSSFRIKMWLSTFLSIMTLLR